MSEIPKRIQKPIPLKLNPTAQQVLKNNARKVQIDGKNSRSQSERSSNLNGEHEVDTTRSSRHSKPMIIPSEKHSGLNSIYVDNMSGNIHNINDKNLNNASQNSFQTTSSAANPSQRSLQDQHIYRSHKFSDQLGQQPGYNMPTQQEQQLPRKHNRQNVIEQEFWLRINIMNAYIPNRHVNWNTDLRQAYIRVSLLEQVGNNYQLLHKHNHLALSTIQHEQITNIISKTTQMSDKILPITSQPQEIFPNSQFYEYFHGENALINAPEDNAPIKERIGIDHFLLNNDDFPIGNSAVCKFCGEKLIFNDSLTSIQEKAYILVEMVQLPNWSSGTEDVLGWGVIKISEILKLENEYFELKLFKQVKHNQYNNVLNKIYQSRPLNVDYANTDVTDIRFLKQAFKNDKIYQPKQIGLLEIKFKFLKDKDQIVQERVVNKRPIYPYDVELGAAVITQAKKAETINDGLINFSKYDINVKKALDELYEQSQQFIGQNVRQTTFNTQHHSSSSFMSNCISQVAACPRGNVCLGAASVLCDSEIYMIVLYNILSGQLLCPLGCHFGYVYKMIFSADGRHLLSCSADGRILIFDVSIFSFYGYNYYFGKPDQVCNEISQIIAKKRSGLTKLTQQEDDVFQYFKDFLNQIQNQQDLLLNYQFGNIQNDMQAVELLSQISQECGGDLNKALTNISQTTIEQITQALLIHYVDQGLCIYDIAQLNTSLQLYIKPMGLLIQHDLNIPQNKFPVNIKVISGNLSGRVNFTLVQQLDVNKPLISNTQLLYSHHDYINVILIQSMKQYDIVISGDSSGIVKFYSLQALDGHQSGINLKFQAEIQTLSQLKDLALLKTKSKEIRLVAISSTFQVQIFDSAGNVVSDVNNEVVKYNQSTDNDEKVQLKIQDLQLPGTARLCTDKQKQFCYVPGYGGAVFCISPNGRIVQSFHVFENNILYGCFISTLLYTPMGLLSAHTTIIEEAENIIKDFSPHGTPKYSQLPIVLMQYSSNYITRQFTQGTVKLIRSDQEVQQPEQQLQPEALQAHPVTETVHPVHHLGSPINETYDEGPVEQMVNDFLNFIQMQRSGINSEQKQ